MSGVFQIRCFSCGKVLKLREYWKMMAIKHKSSSFGDLSDFIGDKEFGSTSNADIFKELGYSRMCCMIALSSSLTGDDMMRDIHKEIASENARKET